MTAVVPALAVLACRHGEGGGAGGGEPHVYKTVGDRKLTLYVIKPADWKAEDRRPAVVFFHGGGWVGGAPGQFTEHAEYLASRGLVAVQVEYRLLDRKANDPPTVCVQDARSAMRRDGSQQRDRRRSTDPAGRAGHSGERHRCDPARRAGDPRPDAGAVGEAAD